MGVAGGLHDEVLVQEGDSFFCRVCQVASFFLYNASDRIFFWSKEPWFYEDWRSGGVLIVFESLYLCTLHYGCVVLN